MMMGICAFVVTRRTQAWDLARDVSWPSWPGWCRCSCSAWPPCTRKASTLPLLPVLIMSRACCKTFAFIFLGIIFAVPLFQGVWEKAVEGESLRVLGVFRKVPSEANLRSFEKELEESCKVADWLRPAYRQLRWMLMRIWATRRGRRGWLGLLRTEHPLPGRRLLQEPQVREPWRRSGRDHRGLRRPTSPSRHRPAGRARAVKPSIAPERLRRGLAPNLDLSVNTRRFMDELRGRGIDVFDLFTPLVREQRDRPDLPRLYLAADTTGLATGSPRGDAAG